MRKYMVFEEQFAVYVVGSIGLDFSVHACGCRRVGVEFMCPNFVGSNF